jgi:predicted ribosome-associated RNA-binding protein Tma20
MPYLMDERDAFRGSKSFNLSSNPAPVNTTTFYNKSDQYGNISINSLSGLVNNDTIYLTGLNIAMKELENGDYKVTIDWGHNRLDNSVAWTGKIALKESLYVYDDDTLLLKQNNTPCQINRNTETLQFAPITTFDCRENSQLTFSNTSRLIVSEKSKLYIQSGSVATIQTNAKLIVKSGSELIIESCGNLVIRENGQLVVESGGKLTIKPGANVFIDGIANLDLQPGFLIGQGGIIISMTNAIELLGVPPLKQITTNTTWQGGTYKFFDDLYISPGATLNLTGSTLQFFRNAKVKVARGAKLNMAGSSKLTPPAETNYGRVLKYGVILISLSHQPPTRDMWL